MANSACKKRVLTLRVGVATLLRMVSLIWRRRSGRLLSVVLLSGLATAAFAEDSTQQVQARDVGQTSPTILAEAQAEVQNVSDDEKPGRARDAVTRMRDLLPPLLKHLEDARAERDVLKLNCVNAKLTVIKGLLKISEQSDVVMQEALARRDVETAAHEFEKISIALKKSEQFAAEGEACVGDLAMYAGDTVVEFEAPEGDSEDSTSNTGGSEVGQVARPQVASPTR